MQETSTIFNIYLRLASKCRNRQLQHQCSTTDSVTNQLRSHKLMLLNTTVAELGLNKRQAVQTHNHTFLDSCDKFMCKYTLTWKKKGLFVITSPLQYWLKFSYTQHLYIYTSKR